MENRSIREDFIKQFGDDDGIVIGRAPGRVNLIGEHTDYNDGFVFPIAIDFYITVAARLRKDHCFRIFSVDYHEMVEGSLETELNYHEEQRWVNYPLGVLWAMKRQGITLSGLEMVFSGNVPQGAGLSSSAALEVATAVVYQQLNGTALTGPEVALLCQKAENDFVGMQCGIMDQFISAIGRRHHALFLDCRSLFYEHIPLHLENKKFIICQSGVKHSLVDSEYNKRRRECEAGVAVLQAEYPGVKALRDASLDQLDTCRNKMDAIVYRRCHHVISENQRVLESVRALHHGDLGRFGELMNASHESLRDDYEVSCREIDILVESARIIPGVYGARITGGGFGGCTINLLDEGIIPDFQRALTESYLAQTGITPRFYLSIAGNGAYIEE
jgi:galactokinase